MGNCLFSQGADDLSLLNDSEGGSLPGEPPPPYQVSSPVLKLNTLPGYLGGCQLVDFLTGQHHKRSISPYTYTYQLPCPHTNQRFIIICIYVGTSLGMFEGKMTVSWSLSRHAFRNQTQFYITNFELGRSM